MMRNGRLLRFVVIPRLRRLYRCPECLLVTDAPDDHARTHTDHSTPRPDPSDIRYHDVIVFDRPSNPSRGSG